MCCIKFPGSRFLFILLGGWGGEVHMLILFSTKCSVDSCKPEGQSTIQHVDKMTTGEVPPRQLLTHGAMGVHPETSVFYFSFLKKNNNYI